MKKAYYGLLTLAYEKEFRTGEISYEIAFDVSVKPI